MKVARFLIKSVFCIMLILTVMVFSIVIFAHNSIDVEYKIKKGDAFNVDTRIPVTAVYEGAEVTQTSLTTIGEEYDVDLKLFGIIPVKSVNVEVVDEMYVAVLGTPFGMKIYTDGVLVSEITDVQTSDGLKNPAKDAGIKVGDYIISVDGEKVYTNEDLSEIVEKSGGKQMDMVVRRGNKDYTKTVKAVISSETDSYKIGIWIKDSSAGIGTLTFYSPAANVICGLGHGICDDETGELLQLNSGEMVAAEITDIEKGSAGSPGQLEGKFSQSSLGNISLNSDCGVYCYLKGKRSFQDYTEIALKQEVKSGKGQILCTVDGETPELYDCKITVRTSAYLSKTQNMVVTVTDKRLLDKTGGIVQGMSGSPVLQDGKLVGAVTHVLVDDSTRGYAIFAENMLETAKSVAQEELKEAS